MKANSYKTILLFSLFSVFTFAQEFDQSFIDSLPENVASDLIEQTSKKNSLEETQYRRPSTFIEKPEPTSLRYGAKIFSMMQTTLMPLNEPNFDSSYPLDAGDELELLLTGQQSSVNRFLINRDGSISINDIGKIYLAGLTLNEAINLIKSKVNESFIGVEAFVTLTSIRDIQVIVVGDAYNPGPYTLNGNSNIFHALSVAGGPSEGGSYRSIDLIRDNKKIETIDLYQTFIFGETTFKTRLRSGDIIFINPVKKIVTLEGAFNRPGEYELIENESLSLAILFANGINKFADFNNIKLDRILDGSIKTIKIVNTSQFDNINADDGDKIFIRAFPFKSVNVIGAVINPGLYLMNEKDTILDAIEKAGGYSNNAYPFGIIYENLVAEEINRNAKDILYNKFLENIINTSQKGPVNQDFSSILQITSQLKDIDVSGRIVADFSSLDQETPILVSNGDIITVPEFQNQVFLFGELSAEGATEFKEGMDIEFYFNMKGGIKNTADKKNIYILQPNGITEKINFNKNVFVNQEKNTKIYPGSIVFVPKRVDDRSSRALIAQAYATILGNIGVSLASISVLKD